jgi:hypothetical protein
MDDGNIDDYDGYSMETSDVKTVTIVAAEYAKLKAIDAKVKKLKSLLLLTDPVVSMNEVNGIALEQWQEFIKCFPDEA